MLFDDLPPAQTPPPRPRPAKAPRPRRTFKWALRLWRPAGTLVAIALAILLGWHVVNGRNGISVWMEKRAEDRQLQKQIKDIQDENARLRIQVDRLQHDPHAIEEAARNNLHYARPGEVIVPIPQKPHLQDPVQTSIPSQPPAQTK